MSHWSRQLKDSVKKKCKVILTISEEIGRLPPPDFSSASMDIISRSAVADLKQYSGDYLVHPSGYNGIWEKSYNLVGMEDFMCLLLSDPSLACRVMDMITEYKVALARE